MVVQHNGKIKARSKDFITTIEDIPIKVTYKNVKNLNLRVYPPNGEVSLSVPMSFSHERIHTFLIQKIGWIRQKRAEIQRQAQVPESTSQIPTEIELLGKRVILQQGNQAKLTDFNQGEGEAIRLTFPEQTSPDVIVNFLDKIALDTMKQKVPVLIAKWEKKIGVQVAEWRIRRMKSRWGSCNPKARRIWLNAELAKKPLECLEYVVVHEMLHLLEQRHNNTFYGLMDHFLPDWKQRKTLLGSR